MRIDLTYRYTQGYLPTRRHRRPRVRGVIAPLSVHIPELNSPSDFPVAFITHRYTSVQEEATCWQDFDGSSDFRMLSEELRVFNGCLFRALRYSYGAAVSTEFMSFTDFSQYLSSLVLRAPSCEADESDVSEDDFGNSIILWNSKTEAQGYIQKQAEKYVIYDGKIWKWCAEPMYNVVTFGLGHNHGGTAMFITHHYNSNLPKDSYFNALQREEAIAYGKAVAQRRGDTKYVDNIGKDLMIDVLMPEMVKRTPQKEHGDGNPFLNCLNALTETADSTFEAGLLVMACAQTEMLDKNSDEQA